MPNPVNEWEVVASALGIVRPQQPLALLIWRTGCSTSRLALPFFDRLAKAYPGSRVVAISQDSAEEAHGYIAQQDLSIESVIDKGLILSSQLAVEVVPAYWQFDSTGLLQVSGAGWNRAHVEQIGANLASFDRVAIQPVIFESDGVPNFKPG